MTKFHIFFKKFFSSIQAFSKALTQSTSLLNTLLCFISIAALLYTVSMQCLMRSSDFMNTHRMILHHLQGESMYSVLRDKDMVYRYPPWTIIAFLPFGALTFEYARISFTLIQIFSVGYILHWVSLRCFPRKSFISVALACWSLWQINAMDGQLSFIITAVLLWAGSPGVFEHFSMKSILLALISSMKVFTAFPLFALKLWNSKTRSTWLKVFIVFSLFCLPPMFLSKTSFLELFQQFFETSSSSGAYLLSSGTRGRYNNGFPGLLTRIFEIPAQKTQYDVLFSVFSMMILGFFWKRESRKLSFDQKWVGWIALIPVIHPLPFWYSFIMAYPLVAITWDAALQSKKTIKILSTLIGIACLAWVTEKSLGKIGSFLELCSIKSWGILILLITLSRKDLRLIKTENSLTINP